MGSPGTPPRRRLTPVGIRTPYSPAHQPLVHHPGFQRHPAHVWFARSAMILIRCNFTSCTSAWEVPAPPPWHRFGRPAATWRLGRESPRLPHPTQPAAPGIRAHAGAWAHSRERFRVDLPPPCHQSGASHPHRGPAVSSPSHKASSDPRSSVPPSRPPAAMRACAARKPADPYQITRSPPQAPQRPASTCLACISPSC